MAKKKGLWANIHAKRKRGESPAKKGSKDYPETLDIGEGMKTARKNVGADTCWDGYKAKGTKKKDGKEVPNCVKEGKLADKMRANLKAKKNEWDEKGTKATKDGYDALDKAKKTQDELEKTSFLQKEGKTFAEFCAEGKSRIETDPDYRKRFKALADNFAEKRKEQTKEKKSKVSEQAGDGYIGPPNLNIKNPMASDATRAAGTVKRKADAKARLAAGGKTSGGIANRLQQRADMINSIGEDVEILDVDGNVVAEIIDVVKAGPTTGWLQQNEGYKKLPKRKIGMKAGKKIISAVGHAGKAGAEEEGTIENQIRMQKAGKKAKQADKMHNASEKHNETLSRAKSLKNKLKGLTKEEYVDEAAWTRKEGKNKAGGLNEKGRKSYERENPGSDLKAPQPEGGPRKRSFCARMGGMKGPLKDEKGEPTRKKLALDKWKC